MRDGLTRWTGWAFIVIATITISAPPAAAQEASGGSFIDTSEGRWRAELAAMAGIHSGSRNREGDFYALGSIEYEMPAWKRVTFGLRFMPLFLYHEDGDDSGSKNIAGAGVGITARIYRNAESRSGLFVEGGTGAILHSDQFAANDSSLNFLSEFGVGYKWENSGWHVALKVQHISNASIGDRNSGINAVGIGAGFTF